MFRTLSVCFCKLANRAVARSIPTSSSSSSPPPPPPPPRLRPPSPSLTYGWNHTHPTHARDRPTGVCRGEARRGEANKSNQSVSQYEVRSSRTKRNEWRRWGFRGGSERVMVNPRLFIFIVGTCKSMCACVCLKYGQKRDSRDVRPSVRLSARARGMDGWMDETTSDDDGFNGFHPRRGPGERDGRRRGDEETRRCENASRALLVFVFL